MAGNNQKNKKQLMNVLEYYAAKINYNNQKRQEEDRQRRKELESRARQRRYKQLMESVSPLVVNPLNKTSQFDKDWMYYAGMPNNTTVGNAAKRDTVQTVKPPFPTVGTGSQLPGTTVQTPKVTPAAGGNDVANRYAAAAKAIKGDQVKPAAGGAPAALGTGTQNKQQPIVYKPIASAAVRNNQQPEVVKEAENGQGLVIYKPVKSADGRTDALPEIKKGQSAQKPVVYKPVADAGARTGAETAQQNVVPRTVIGNQVQKTMIGRVPAAGEYPRVTNGQLWDNYQQYIEEQRQLDYDSFKKNIQGIERPELSWTEGWTGKPTIEQSKEYERRKRNFRAYDQQSDPALWSDEYRQTMLTMLPGQVKTYQAKAEEAKAVSDKYSPMSISNELFDWREKWQQNNQNKILGGAGYSDEDKRFAQDVLNKMGLTVEDRRADTQEFAKEFLNREDNWFEQYDQQELRERVYAFLMDEDYNSFINMDNVTAKDKVELNLILDRFIEAAKTEGKELAKYSEEEYKAAQDLADAYSSLYGKTLDVEKNYQGIINLEKWADESGKSGEYNPNLHPKVVWVTNTEMDRIPQPQGTDIEKSYFWANNPNAMEGMEDNPKYARPEYFMTPDQLDHFNKLYAVTGSNLAEQYLNKIMPSLERQLREHNERYNQAIAETPVLGEVARVLSPAVNAAGGLVGTVGTVLALLGNKDAQKGSSDWYAVSNFVQTLRSHQNDKIGQWFEEKYGSDAGGIAKFMMNVFDSIGDNLFAMGTANGLTGGNLASRKGQAIIQLIMSGEATSNTMLTKLASGMGAQEAALYAISDGVIEWFTERVSLEALLKPNVRGMIGNGKQLANYLFKASVAEGSEEIAADLCNMCIDYILSMVKDHETEFKEKYNARLRAYDAQQIPAQEARKRAMRETLEETMAQTGLSGLAGFISGGFLAGGRVATNMIGMRGEGKYINSSGRLNDLIGLGLKQKAGTQGHSIAESLQQKQNEGKKISNLEIGKLKENIEADAMETLRDSTDPKTGIPAEEGLNALGVLDSVQAIAGNTNVRGAGSDSKTHIRLATSQEMADAKGTKVDGSRGAVYLQDDGTTVHARIVGIKSIYNDKTKKRDVKVTVSFDGTETDVDPSKVLSNTYAGAVLLTRIQNNEWLYSPDFTNVVLQEMDKDENADRVVAPLAESIRLAAITDGEMPKTGLSEESAQRIWDASVKERTAMREKARQGQYASIPGKGNVTYKGTRYGTPEYDQKVKDDKLSKWQRNLMGAAAEIAMRAGMDVTFMDQYELENERATGRLKNSGSLATLWGIEGYESRNGKGIVLNIEGQNVGSDIKGSHHMLVAFGHEFTHWLQRHGGDAYLNLEKFVIDAQRQALGGQVGLNSRLLTIMQSRKMNVFDAMSELVADSCDQILSNDKVIEHIQQTNKTVYGYVKAFVKDLVARIHNAIDGMGNSMSKDAKRIYKQNADRMAELFNLAYDEATGQVVDAPAVTDAAQTADMAQSEDGRFSQAEEDSTKWKLVSESNGEYYETDQQTGEKTKLTGADAEYVKAWKKGDFRRMEEILAEKIRENGAIPFKTPNSYSTANHRWVANAIKEGNMMAIQQAAAEMAEMVPENAVLVPMPNHHGVVDDSTDTMILAQEIGKLTGRQVIVALQGVERESRQQDKNKPKSQQMQAEDLGFRQVAEIPEGMVPYFVDNVIASGLTAEAAHKALGNNGVTIAYAKSTRSANDGLKRANATFYDTNKQYGSYLIPLSERINMERTGYEGVKYSSAEMDAEYEQAVKDGDTKKQQALVDAAAKKAGYTVYGTHRTNGKFTVFEKSKRTGERGATLGDGFYIAKGEGTEYDSPHYGKNRMLVYVKTGNVFDIQKGGLSGEEAERVYNEYFAPYHPAAANEEDSPYRIHVINQLQKGYKVMDYIKEAAENANTTTDEIFKSLGYDSIKDGPQYAVFESSQIKLADPVTYDDNGNVIPLSERFNDQQADIRYSSAEVTNDNDQHEYMKSFKEQLEDFLKNPKTWKQNNAFVVGQTPELMQKMGMTVLPVTINKSHISAALLGTYSRNAKYINDHIVDIEELAKLPEKLNKPIAIMQSNRPGKIIVFVDMTAKSGKPLVVPIEINTRSTIEGKQFDTINLLSLHRNIAQTNTLVGVVNKYLQNNDNNRLIYLDRNKYNKMTKALKGEINPGIHTSGMDLPNGLIHTLNELSEDVKPLYQKQTETKNFKDWFKNSVIVNEDGTPKIMYHGTLKGGFTEFGGRNNFWYFSDSKKYANIFAGRRNNNTFAKGIREDIKKGVYKPEVYEVYLSVQNPYITDDMDVIETALYWDNSLVQQLKNKGYDALMLSDQSQVIVLDKNQIKSAKNNIGMFDERNNDIRYSSAEMDAEYEQAVKDGDEQKQQEMVLDAGRKAGYTIRAYHGTARGDRVGTVFLPERATSGPMAYFTDNRGIAENYARDKRDTSIDYDEEYGDYETQFRVKTKDGKTIPVVDLWKTLSFAERQKITEAAKHITLDDEAEEIIWDENAQHGIGNFTDYERKLHGWNSIRTLMEGWLYGGTLFGREGDFLKVLEMAGIKGVTWNNPDERHEKVYDVLLKIQNPFDTETMYTGFVEDFESWWMFQDKEKYQKENRSADLWDKNGISIEDWIAYGFDDTANGRTSNWTRIPDAVTAYLKELGYDGIKDTGGKGGGQGHTVWIPFSSEQVKSAEPVVYDDNGKVIPLSERFNEQQTDIRYSQAEESAEQSRASQAEGDEIDVENWMESRTEGSFRTEDERVMWRTWKRLRNDVRAVQFRIEEYRKQIKALEAIGDENLTQEERDQLKKLQEKLFEKTAQLDKLEKQLRKTTSTEGFATMMKNANMVIGDFMAGRTQDQVTAAVDRMTGEVEEAEKEMAKQEKALLKLGQESAVKTVRAHLRYRGMNTLVSALKTQYGTTMSREELEGRISEIILKSLKGEDVTEEIEALASDVVTRQNGYGNIEAEEVLSQLRGRTIVIGPGQQAELKANHLTLKELRQRIKGSGIKLVYGDTSTLDTDAEEIIALAPGLQGQLDNEKASLENFISFVENMLSLKKGSAADSGIDQQEVEAFIGAMAVNMLNEDVGGIKKEDLIAKIKADAGRIGSALAAVRAIQQGLKTIRESGEKAQTWSGVLRQDMETALDYYDKVARMAAQQERQSVRKSLIEQLKAENTKKLIAQQQYYQEMMKSDRNAREMANDIMTLRSKINTTVKRVSRLLTQETDLKNIPEEAKPLARLLIKMFVEHDSNYRRVTFSDNKQLQKAAENLKGWQELFGDFNYETGLDWLIIGEGEDADYEIRDRIEDALKDIEIGLMEYRNAEGKRNISLQDRKAALEKVQKAVSTVWDVIQARRTAIINGQRMIIDDLAMSAVDDMQDSRFKGEWAGKGARGWLARNVAGRTRTAVGYGNMTPVYFFKNLKNRVMSLLFGEHERAENRNGLEIAKAQLRLAQIAQETGYETWDQKKKYTLKLEKGGEVQLTLGEMMSLYAIWQREDMNQKEKNGPEKSFHLAKGGFYIEEDLTEGEAGRRKLSRRAHRLTEADIETIKGMMTKEQLDYIEKMVSYITNEIGELGNEASMKMYGIRKFNEKWYFPMESWNGVLRSKSSAGTQQSKNAAAHQSHTIRRQNNANNALVIRDFTQTVVKHIVAQINYNTFAPSIEWMQRVMNTKLTEGADEDSSTQRTLWAMFQEAYGTDAFKYLKRFQQDMNGGATQNESTMYDKLISTFRKSAVAGSLSVALQQPLSYIRAAMVINPKWLTLAMNPKYYKGSTAEMEAHSGVAVLKRMGKFDMGIGASAQNYIAPDAKQSMGRQAYETASKWTTMLPELMDRVTWTRLWTAAKLEQASLHPGMDQKSEEFMELVTNRFNDIIRMTQVYDSTLVRSQNMRSQKPALKMMTSFMAEPTLTANILVDSIINRKEAGGKMQIAKAGATFMLSAVAQAVVKGLMSAGRNPDRKKTWNENFWYRFLYNFISEANTISLIPGYNSLVTLLKDGELSDNAFAMIGKFFEAGGKTYQLMTGKSEDIYRSIEDSAALLAQLFTNIPAKNIMRDVRAMYNFFTQPYAQRATSAGVLKYQAQDLLLSGNELLGAINERLGKDGYQATVDAYAQRIFDAEQKGNTKAAQEMKDYVVLAKSKAEDPEAALNEKLRSMAKKDENMSAEEKVLYSEEHGATDKSSNNYVIKLLKSGELSAEEARKMLKEYNPDKSDNEIWWTVDRYEYARETGAEKTPSGYYYRLTDAINSNKADAINAAVKEIVNHGVDKKKVKDKLSDWKSKYLNGTQQQKIRIRNAIEIAYKALGFTKQDADKVIDGWKKKK